MLAETNALAYFARASFVLMKNVLLHRPQNVNNMLSFLKYQTDSPSQPLETLNFLGQMFKKSMFVIDEWAK